MNEYQKISHRNNHLAWRAMMHVENLPYEAQKRVVFYLEEALREAQIITREGKANRSRVRKIERHDLQDVLAAVCHKLHMWAIENPVHLENKEQNDE